MSNAVVTDEQVLVRLMTTYGTDLKRLCLCLLNDSVYIVFGIKDAKRLSLELSFLDVDRHCYDPMTTRKLYYWR